VNRLPLALRAIRAGRVKLFPDGSTFVRPSHLHEGRVQRSFARGMSNPAASTDAPFSGRICLKTIRPQISLMDTDSRSTGRKVDSRLRGYKATRMVIDPSISAVTSRLARKVEKAARPPFHRHSPLAVAIRAPAIRRTAAGKSLQPTTSLASGACVAPHDAIGCCPLALLLRYRDTPACEHVSD